MQMDYPAEHQRRLLMHRAERRDRRGEMQIGRKEALVGVAVVIVLLLIAVPFGISKAKKSKRGEVPLLVQAIHATEVTHAAAFKDEGYVACEAAPRAMHAVDDTTAAWASNRGYDRLAWAPESAEVYGAYKVTVEGDSFTVHGACDVDGDGERSLYAQGKDATEAAMSTEANIF
jgi:hypothetical protein